MPATLPIPAQVNIDPVGHYYKGKALRQQLSTAKKQEELLDKQLEAFGKPDPKEKREQAKADREAIKFGSNTIYEMTTNYAKDFEAGGEQAASDNLLASLAPIYEAMPEGPEKETMGRYFEDKYIDKDEAGRIRSVAARHAGIEEAGGDTQTERMIANLPISDTEKAKLSRQWVEKQVGVNTEFTVDAGDIARLAENFTSDSIKKWSDFISGGGDVLSSGHLLSPLPTLDKNAGEINKRIDTSLGTIDAAINLVGAGTTGAPGWFNRIKETVGGYTSPDAPQEAKEFAEMVTLLQATNWREIVGSGQLSTADYTFLDSLFKGKNLLDDPVSTKRSLQLLRGWLEAKKTVSNAVAPSRYTVEEITEED
jgi:hypothetical protein